MFLPDVTTVTIVTTIIIAITILSLYNVMTIIAEKGTRRPAMVCRVVSLTARARGLRRRNKTIDFPREENVLLLFF